MTAAASDALDVAAMESEIQVISGRYADLDESLLSADHARLIDIAGQLAAALVEAREQRDGAQIQVTAWKGTANSFEGAAERQRKRAEKSERERNTHSRTASRMTGIADRERERADAEQERARGLMGKCNQLENEKDDLVAILDEHCAAGDVHDPYDRVERVCMDLITAERGLAKVERERDDLRGQLIRGAVRDEGE